MKRIIICSFFILSLFSNYTKANEITQPNEELVTTENKDNIKNKEQKNETTKENGTLQFLNNYKNLPQEVIIQGLKYIGIPYKWGGETEEDGFDCSGLVQTVFESSIGLNLPRTAKGMSSVGEKILSYKELKPGDLVFFNTMRRAYSHVGIYIGENQFLHAPRTGANVTIAYIDSSYWANRFNGARRLIQGEQISFK